MDLPKSMDLPKFMITHVPLIIIIVITILTSIVIFSILGISFKSNNVSVLKRAALVETR